MHLTSFEKNPPDAVPKTLDDYLEYIARTGNTVFPWPKIKPLFRFKLEKVISEFYQSCPVDDTPQVPNVEPFKFGTIKEKIFEQLESFTGIPFTIQRLCELMTQPKKHYRRTDKFMRGLEKIMLVVSTVEAQPLGGEHASLSMNGDNVGEGTSGTNGHNNLHSLDNIHHIMAEHNNLDHGSPSKRPRLSSPQPQEEETGPCDSADGAAPQIQEKVDVDTDPEAQSSSSVVVTDGLDEQEEMDIDTECTSSQAAIQQLEEDHVDGVESSDESIVKIKQRTDSESTAEALSDVDASDLDLEDLERSDDAAKVEDNVSTSEEKGVEEGEGVRVAENGGGDDCSSSDDPVVEVGGAEEGGCVSQSHTPTNMEEDSEATPADREEGVETEGESSESVMEEVETASASDDVCDGGGEEEGDNVSVQSSDSSDSITRTDTGGAEKEEGAADSSSGVKVVSAVEIINEDAEAVSDGSSKNAAQIINENGEQKVDSENNEDNPSQSSSSVE